MWIAKLKKCRRKILETTTYDKLSNYDILLNSKYDKIYINNYERDEHFIQIIINGAVRGYWNKENFIIKEIK